MFYKGKVWINEAGLRDEQEVMVFDHVVSYTYRHGLGLSARSPTWTSMVLFSLGTDSSRDESRLQSASELSSRPWLKLCHSAHSVQESRRCVTCLPRGPESRLQRSRLQTPVGRKSRLWVTIGVATRLATWSGSAQTPSDSSRLVLDSKWVGRLVLDSKLTSRQASRFENNSNTNGNSRPRTSSAAVIALLHPPSGFGFRSRDDESTFYWEHM